MHARVPQQAVDAAQESGRAEGHPEDVIQQPDENDDAQGGHGHGRLLLRDGYPWCFCLSVVVVVVDDVGRVSS